MPNAAYPRGGYSNEKTLRVVSQVIRVSLGGALGVWANAPTPEISNKNNKNLGFTGF
jgi:hypothetical protein